MIADGPGGAITLTRPDHNPGPSEARTMATFQNITATPDSQAAIIWE